MWRGKASGKWHDQLARPAEFLLKSRAVQMENHCPGSIQPTVPIHLVEAGQEGVLRTQALPFGSFSH